MLHNIHHLLIAVCLTTCSIVAQAKDPIPKEINMVYDVSRNGQPFATVTESYRQLGNDYHIVSITKGLGVYALFGERKLMSDGVITAAGLKPSHFELRQGDNAKKWLSAAFDWKNKTLNMSAKGEIKTTELPDNAQDLASYLYQFMFERKLDSAPLANQPADFVVNVTTAKNVKPFKFEVRPIFNAMQLTAGNFKVIELTSVKDVQLDNVQTASKTSDDRQIWLATEKFNLPVKLIMHDDKGGDFEQTLKSMELR